MKSIIFVGAGGFAKELYGYIQSEIKTGDLKNYRIKGFLDISYESYKTMKVGSEYLGSEDDYEVENGDEFIIAIGDINLKEIVVEKLLSKNVTFMTYIHATAIIDNNSQIGKGVVICPYSMVNSQATVDDFSMLNIYSSVAHDSSLGAYSILSPYATLNGGVSVGKKTFMATRSSILPGIKVGDDCVVAAGTVVSKDMAENVMAIPKARTVYIEKKE